MSPTIEFPPPLPMQIERGHPHWPAGLNDLGDDAPKIVYVHGNLEALNRPIVLVDGLEYASPKAMAEVSKLANLAGTSNVAIAGMSENPTAKLAVRMASAEGAGAVYLAREPMQAAGDDLTARREVLENGGAVVSFSDGGLAAVSEARFTRASAALSTVTYVFESDTNYDSTALAEAALKLGRSVAVATPPEGNDLRYSGNRELLNDPNVTAVATAGELLRLVEPGAPPLHRSLAEQLEDLEFSERITELKSAGRLDPATEQALADMVAVSNDLSDFQARMHSGGVRDLGAVEYRYLNSALETPLGQRPESWNESAVWVRSFGVDQYQSTAIFQQAEQHREATMTQSYT